MPASTVDSAKRQAAYRAVDEHFPASARNIGIGSGSTVVHVVDRIAQLPREKTDHVTFVPTGYQSRELIIKAGLRLGNIDLVSDLDVVFDGADEVDPFLNCIKGGGACLFQEKLVAITGRKLIIVADHRKLSPSLSTHWAAGIPIEVVPPAASHVLARLTALGAASPQIRMGGSAKAGPVITDNGNFIIDAPFPDGFIPAASHHMSPPRPLSPSSSAAAVDAGLTAETGAERVGGSDILGKEEGHPGAAVGMGLGVNENVEELARALKAIVGVVEHGIFWAGDRKAAMAYFGMEDGSVSVRGGHAQGQSSQVQVSH
ncbi:ribose 5-phosphate isomerase A [Geopyxis carbonaria]|nr:ribose 5-phosphate isomerase A [Geopyxis carbonaria]